MSQIKKRAETEDGFLAVCLHMVSEWETQTNFCYQSGGTLGKRMISPEHLQIKVNSFS